MLVRSVRNTLQPQVQPQAVAAIAARLPNDPKAIEAYVLDKQVPYAYDWQTAGVPWYFPTTAEASRPASATARAGRWCWPSILTAKGIPNHLYMSLDHIWVDYPGKTANALENPAVQIAGRQNGEWFFHLPQVLRPAARSGTTRWASTSRRRPGAQGVLLLGGTLAHRALEHAGAAARRRPAGRRRAAARGAALGAGAGSAAAGSGAGAPPLRAAAPAARLRAAGRFRTTPVPLPHPPAIRSSGT